MLFWKEILITGRIFLGHKLLIFRSLLKGHHTSNVTHYSLEHVNSTSTAMKLLLLSYSSHTHKTMLVCVDYWALKNKSQALIILSLTAHSVFRLAILKDTLTQKYEKQVKCNHSYSKRLMQTTETDKPATRF